MKLTYTPVIILSLIIFTSSKIYAENVNYKLRVLPIDCVFEVIDIGTQQLRFLTPETCPSEPVPPVVEPPDYTSSENPITIKPAYYNQVEPTPSLSSPAVSEKPKVASGEALKDIPDLINTSLDSKIFAIAIIGFLATTLFLIKNNKRNR